MTATTGSCQRRPASVSRAPRTQQLYDSAPASESPMSTGWNENMVSANVKAR